MAKLDASVDEKTDWITPLNIKGLKEKRQPARPKQS